MIFRGRAGLPIVVVMVPRMRLLLYGDHIYAEDKMCIKAANRRSTRSVRGEVLSVAEVLLMPCYHHPVRTTRQCTEGGGAAAAAVEDRKVAGMCVGNSSLIVGGPASFAFISPPQQPPRGNVFFVIVCGVGLYRVLSCRSTRARGPGRAVARSSDAAAA